MNRRNVIRGIAAAAVLPAVPAASAAKSLEERKREAVKLLLTIPEIERLPLCSLSHALTPGHPQYGYSRDLFDSGIPVMDCYERTLARIG